VRKVVAFALETSQGKRRARAKMAAKNADWIVLNGAEALGGDRTSVTLMDRAGNELELLDRTKVQVARVVIGLLE
jgi:phosphopantothenoylcysteine synthetase/decarboxylase